jgi:hypothetical protein
MINEIKDHFILVDKCAEETRIVEIKNKKIVKITCWQDDKPPLIGNVLDAKIIKKLNSGIVRASLKNKKIITVRVGKKSFKINEKIKVTITSEEFEDKPIQAKLWSRNFDFEKLNDAERIINLFFSKNIPVIEDNYAIYWNNMDLDSCFLSALDPMVKIEDGGILWIEKTKAATLIDVDTKNLLINNEDEMLKFCKNVFIRCIDEIKLRNIGGMVLIDFPRVSFSRKKNLHEFITKEGTKKFPESNFLGFSRLQIYEMYVLRNFKSLESFYINKNEFDLQNHLRSLWRLSKEIKSKNNIQFLCGKNLYKRLKLKKTPEFINIVERIDLPKDYGELLEKKI